LTEQQILTKGTALIDLVKLARKHRAAFEPRLPAETRGLLEDRILAGSWYPEAHLENLLVAADQVLGGGDFALCRSFGRTAARQAVESLYRSTLVPGDVVASLKVLSATWSLMHNTGAVAVEVPGETSVRVTLRDFGRPSPALCAVFAGWIEGKAEAAGAEAEVAEESCRRRGDGACVYAVQWTRAAP
jgi:hypothetical protein